MASPIIEVENLAKLYRLGTIGENTLRHAAGRLVSILRGRTPTPVAHPAVDGRMGPQPNTFWALRDISFRLEEGEIMGIIGRNGAGKSTLLKILARITEPSSGRAILRGRVGSILEVGTGFHPELTGRDNIFLNGAILGMKRSEIRRKFDEIVEFAEVGDFIDTPVKRYSSGMYVRLAFAVAAHLDSDILIIDEVLAVGDARFQKKCLAKIQDVSTAQGRTIIFVSHNTEAVQRLCSHCLLLDRGRLVKTGPTVGVIEEYLGANLPHAAADTWIDVSKNVREGGTQAKFVQIRFSSGDRDVGGQAYADGPLEIDLTIEAKRPVRVQSIAVGLRDHFERRLVNADTGIFGETIDLPQGKSTVRLRIDAVHLKPGLYGLSLWMARYVGKELSPSDIMDYVEKAIEVEVVHGVVSGTRSDIGGTAPVTCDFKLVEVIRPSIVAASFREG